MQSFDKAAPQDRWKLLTKRTKPRFCNFNNPTTDQINATYNFWYETYRMGDTSNTKVQTDYTWDSEFNLEELKVIENTNHKKSPGVDSITFLPLKMIAREEPEILLKVINSTIRSGRPGKLNQGKTLLLPKGHNATEPQYFRPI